MRDGEFREVYDPISREASGGLQERDGRGIVAWKSELHQTWSATGYLRLMVFDLAGMNFDENGVVFEPHLPEGIQRVDLTGISYRKAMLNVHVRGVGGHIAEMTVNGRREPALTESP